MVNINDVVIKTHTSILEIDAQAWDALTDQTPLISHAFLSALETSGSVGQDTGWIPYPLAIYDADGLLIGAMPLYLKTHSYGEYVFDWSWADAYARNQLNYYPKLICAIPFSPITCRRLLTKDSNTAALLLNSVAQILKQHHLSSAHLLFPNDDYANIMQPAGWHKRSGVQFRWQNNQYADFDTFLNTLSHDKRKKIKQERKKVVQAGVQSTWILGQDITENDWDFFYACYCNTYHEHHSTPYLTRAFFTELSKSMPNNILLIVAEMNGKPVASALNIYNAHTLYGRYWGAMQFVSGLHFELCYYQAQMFCIAHHIQYFEGGAQGEHKLARGFEPRPTCSYHKIIHPDFEAAIADFLIKESTGILAYTHELETRTPFKHPSLPTDGFAIISEKLT